MEFLLQKYQTLKSGTLLRWLILFFGLIIITCLMGAISYDIIALALVPAALLIGYLCIVDFKKVFFLLFASIPISTEVYLPNGFSTDLPSEPLMVLLMGVTFLYILLNAKILRIDFIRHPVTLFLLLHLGWIFVSTIASENIVVSFKYSLSKVWYVTVFYFLAAKLIRTEKDMKTLFWLIFIPLVFAVTIIEIRHAAEGFSFESIHYLVDPFFRNHVTYAALTTLFMPFAFYALWWYQRWSVTWWIVLVGMLIILAGIQFSYTRAAYIALVMAIGAYYVIRLKMMRWALLAASLATFAFIGFLLQKNHFLNFAPDYQKTVSHKSFDNLLEATYKLEDISTMERVYRWVAAGHMIGDKPYLGWGPGNFHDFYKNYTVSSFRTYVSDNPEKSGIHCYFLMVWVEQGIIGILLFLLFNFSVLLLGEKVYHETKDTAMRRISLMATLSFVIINALLIINDLIETDKVGTFFFFSAAILVSINIENKRKSESKL